MDYLYQLYESIQYYWGIQIAPILPIFKFIAFIFIFILLFDIFILVTKLRIFTVGVRKFFKGTTVKKIPSKSFLPIWDNIIKKSHSLNPNEWKIAIIEADKLVDNILQEAGYKGETMADRLKSLVAYGYKSLDDVWYAHKIRNRIAHENNFELDEDIVKRVIDGYEKFFEELELL